MIQMNLEGIPCSLIRSVALIIALLLKLWCKGKNFYDKGQSINAETLTVKIRFFILLYKFTKNILKQFNFQQKHIRFIFLSVSLQKI